MPSGACTIRVDGKRGAVWYVKFRDANGTQVKQRLGPEPAWNEQRSERELGKRLQAVERDRWRKPDLETFAAFAKRFEEDYLPGRNLEPQRQLVIGDHRRFHHLLPFFGDQAIAAVEPADVDAYVAWQTGRLAPKTISNHLGMLRVMFKVAERWRIVASNPLAHVERPRIEQTEMNVLSEAEIAALLKAYDEAAARADATRQNWWLLSRRIVQVALGTALRRGELLALRWQDVKLLEGLLTVRQSLVRGEFQTPKSRTSRRTIELGPKTKAVLQEQWQTSGYRSDTDLVFGHPALGTPLDPSKLSREYLRPALTTRPGS